MKIGILHYFFIITNAKKTVYRTKLFWNILVTWFKKKKIKTLIIIVIESQVN